MRIWGKVLGTFFGFLLGNIFGALLGLWIGHRFDRGMGIRGAFQRAPSQQQQAVFFHATFAVMGHIAKASGQVTEHEIRVASNLMDRMRLAGEQRVRAQESFRLGKESDFPCARPWRSFARRAWGSATSCASSSRSSCRPPSPTVRWRRTSGPSCKPSPTSWGSVASSWPAFWPWPRPR